MTGGDRWTTLAIAFTLLWFGAHAVAQGVLAAQRWLDESAYEVNAPGIVEMPPVCAFAFEGTPGVLRTECSCEELWQSLEWGQIAGVILQAHDRACGSVRYEVGDP